MGNPYETSNRVDNSTYRPSYHPSVAASLVVDLIEVPRREQDPLVKMGLTKLEQRGLIHLDRRGNYWPCTGAVCRHARSHEVHSAQGFWDWADLRGYTVDGRPLTRC